MTLTSFVDERNGARIPRIEMAARSSRFFDGVYRVRVRIDSEYSTERGSSLSYHQYGQEKAERKDELWQVDFAAAEVRRTRGAESKTFPLPSQGVVDPLTFLYRMRVLLKDAGEEATLAMMTSRGAVDTVAQVVEKRSVKTPFGKRDVLVVVPRPENEELFSRKGTMEIWFGADEARLPYRVRRSAVRQAVARLEKVEPAPASTTAGAGGADRAEVSRRPEAVRRSRHRMPRSCRGLRGGATSRATPQPGSWSRRQAAAEAAAGSALPDRSRVRCRPRSRDRRRPP
jgi:hypothetical protein